MKASSQFFTDTFFYSMITIIPASSIVFTLLYAEHEMTNGDAKQNGQA
jgi:hypothetical protein